MAVKIQRRIAERVSLIAADCEAIKKAVRMDSPILSREHLPAIDAEAFKIIRLKHDQRRGRVLFKYPYHEIMHFFYTNHIPAVLRPSVKLSESEEAILRKAMGRLSYNVPSYEYHRRGLGIQALQRLGQRGVEINDACWAEFLRLSAMHKGIASTLAGDFFNAPLNTIAINPDSLEKKAKFMFELAESLRKDGR